MKLSFCSLASGSSGNCYLVRTESTAILVDAGISGRRIFAGLAALGMNQGDVDGVFNNTRAHRSYKKRADARKEA